MLYFIMDGDDIGKGIEASILEEDIPRMIRITQEIQAALNIIVDVVRENQGEVVYRGCDDISGRIAADKLGVLDDMILRFTRHTGFSASIGVGDSLHEAYLALRFAKCRGKGQVLIWNHRSDHKPPAGDNHPPV